MYTYIYISNRIDCQCTYVQKHIDDLDYMYMTFMMDYMETCPGHVATVQHHAPAVQAFCHFNVLPRVAANLFMEWRYDWKYDTCNHLTHIAHHPCLYPGCILMAVHELQHICEWSGDMIEMLKRTSRNL